MRAPDAGFDGDDRPDFAVAAPNADGSIGATGSTMRDGLVYGYSGATLARRFAIAGSASGPRGATVATVGDIDLDGVTEIAIGSRSGGGTIDVHALGDADRNGERDVCEPCAGARALVPGVALEFEIGVNSPDPCFVIDVDNAERISLQGSTIAPKTFRTRTESGAE